MAVPRECQQKLPQEQGAPFPLGLTQEWYGELAGFSHHLVPINSSRLTDKELLEMWTEVPRLGAGGRMDIILLGRPPF